MIDGIRPPRRSVSTPSASMSPPDVATPSPAPLHAPSPLSEMPTMPEHRSAAALPPSGGRQHRRRLGRWIVGIGFLILLLIGIGVTVWGNYQLSPMTSGGSSRVRVTIASGMTPREIATELQSKGLIRDVTVFELYARLTGAHSKLQAGRYSLSPSESTPQIIDHLKAGKTDTIQITFYPGATLRDTWSAENKRSDATTTLRRAGYPQAEIDAALAKSYTHPLFADKPAGTSLEGYIFGETYTIDVSASVEEVLRMTFDEYWKYIQANRLVEAFRSRGLNLYQGITLASIVQREVSNATDQAQVAQVFYTRLATDTVLGSDVTFIYAAQQMGVPPTVDLKSPYNTRQVKGLPPGPIATPGLGALKAVAAPASGSYVYFVAGEDGRTYFAYTEAEHNKNIRDHCGSLCR